ncbi:MAG: zinc ribbon domain-containing protein [Candidatus Bathyarchaeia archaeon]
MARSLGDRRAAGLALAVALSALAASAFWPVYVGVTYDSSQSRSYFYVSPTERYYYVYYSWPGYYYSYHYGYVWAYRTYYYKVYEFYLTVNATPEGIGPVSGGGWYKEGSTASFSAPAQAAGAAEGVRYIFDRWTGDYSGQAPFGTITMDKPKTVTAVYRTQYYLETGSSPSGLPKPGKEGWYDAGAKVPISPPQRIVSDGPAKRYVFDHWSLDGQRVDGEGISVDMGSPHKLIAVYKAQYYLSVSSPYGDPKGSGWYDEGSTATISVNTPIEAGFGVSQVFVRWSGDISSESPTAQVLMDGPKTAAAVWRTDSTILYATVALIAAAIAASIAALAFAVRRGLGPFGARLLCSNCGARVPRGALFCPSCGRRQGASPGEAEARAE